MSYHSLKIGHYTVQLGTDVRMRFIAPLGITLSMKGKHSGDDITFVSSKVKKSLDIIENPFIANPTDVAEGQKKIRHYSWLLKAYSRLLVFAYHHFYFILYLLSHLRMSMFENSTIATDYFTALFPGNQQSKLCLPRSIFAATTSKRFRKDGCMFIGVFLPSTSMHAWIIENDRIVYRDDHYWTLYTPINVMT